MISEKIGKYPRDKGRRTNQRQHNKCESMKTRTVEGKLEDGKKVEAQAKAKNPSDEYDEKREPDPSTHIEMVMRVIRNAAQKKKIAHRDVLQHFWGIHNESVKIRGFPTEEATGKKRLTANQLARIESNRSEAIIRKKKIGCS